jgi:hypothetical protein
MDLRCNNNKFWSDLPKGEPVAYLDRLIPFAGKKLLLRYDDDSSAFMFNKVKIHEDWLVDIERLYVFSGEDVD